MLMTPLPPHGSKSALGHDVAGVQRYQTSRAATSGDGSMQLGEGVPSAAPALSNVAANGTGVISVAVRHDSPGAPRPTETCTATNQANAVAVAVHGNTIASSEWALRSNPLDRTVVARCVPRT